MFSCLQADFESDMDEDEMKDREALNDQSDSEPQDEGISEGPPVTIYLLLIVIKLIQSYN